MYNVLLDGIQSLAVIDTRSCSDDMIEKAKKGDPLFVRHVRIIGSFGAFINLVYLDINTSFLNLYPQLYSTRFLN